MAGRGEHMASERRAESAERQRNALELRKAGIDYRAIADKLGYEGPSGAHKAVKTALRAIIREPAEELRMVELARLDAMLTAIWQEVRKGNLKAIDRALKISVRRAALLGLDEPAKLNIALLVESAATELGLTETERLALLADVEAFIAAPKALTS